MKKLSLLISLITYPQSEDDERSRSIYLQVTRDMFFAVIIFLLFASMILYLPALHTFQVQGFMLLPFLALMLAIVVGIPSLYLRGGWSWHVQCASAWQQFLLTPLIVLCIYLVSLLTGTSQHFQLWELFSSFMVGSLIPLLIIAFRAWKKKS